MKAGGLATGMPSPLEDSNCILLDLHLPSTCSHVTQEPRASQDPYTRALEYILKSGCLGMTPSSSQSLGYGNVTQTFQTLAFLFGKPGGSDEHVEESWWVSIHPRGHVLCVLPTSSMAPSSLELSHPDSHYEPHECVRGSTLPHQQPLLVTFGYTHSGVWDCTLGLELLSPTWVTCFSLPTCHFLTLPGLDPSSHQHSPSSFLRSGFGGLG